MKGLEFLFRPRDIAVVGASENPGKVGHTVVKNLLASGYPGGLHLINPNVESILGRKCLSSLRELKPPVDLLLMCVPAGAIPALLGQARGVAPSAMIVYAAAQAELGRDVHGWSEDLGSWARAAGCRVLGPGSSGVVNAPDGVNATPWDLPLPAAGGISFVSQSGSFGSLLLAELRARGLGLARGITLGRLLDLGWTECLSAFGADDRTEALGILLEHVQDGPGFVRSVSDVALKRPVVVLQVGTAAEGRAVVARDAGVSPGDPAVMRAVFRQAGMKVAGDSGEFLDALAVLALSRRMPPASDRVAAVGVSAAACALTADACAAQGLSLPPLSRRTQTLLQKTLPFSGFQMNPVELSPVAGPEALAAALEVVASDPAVGAVVVSLFGWDAEGLAPAIAAARDGAGRPFTVALADGLAGHAALAAARIPTFPTPERAVRALRILCDHQRQADAHRRRGIRSATAPSGARPGGGPRPDRPRAAQAEPCPAAPGLAELHAILKAAGVPVPPAAIVRTRAEAERFSRKAGTPVLMAPVGETARPGRGGVPAERLDSVQRLSARFGAAARRSSGRGVFLLRQPDGPPVGLCRRGVDPQFGAVLTLQALEESSSGPRPPAVGLCPLGRADAAELLREAGLAGPPGREKADPAASDAAQLLARLSDVMESHPEIGESTFELRFPARGRPTAVPELRSS